MHIFDHISEDLQQVQLLLKKNLAFRAGYLGEFVPLKFNYLDMYLRPAVVISANRLFGPVSTRTIALAAIIQFIFLASRVHSGVKESLPGKERSQDNRTGYQYPVLVGDYLYGKFFTTLCEFGITRYLKELAELICAINKSGIQTLRNPGLELIDRRLYLDTVRGETAEALARGARLGADLAGAGTKDKNTLYNFGFNLGMAYGLLEKNAPLSQVREYLAEAETMLLQLPAGSNAQHFKELLGLMAQGNAMQRLVV